MGYNFIIFFSRIKYHCYHDWCHKLGIGLSFIKKIRNTSNSFSIGEYLIYMFSLAIGLSFDLSHINKEIFTLLLFFCTVQFGSVALHMLLSKLFHIDGKITLITSTAGIYGPAFIIPVANALKTRDVILPGLICRISGYAIGNYLGIATAMFLGTFA